jgi:flavodoxin I
MKTIIIYDSQYGFTEQIAKAMGKALGKDARVVKVTQVKAADIADYSLVLVGSPTQGGRPTPAVATFIDNLPENVFAGKRLAAFDTRLKAVFAKVFGYAAPRIEAAIKAKGGNVTAQPQGFFVKGAKGPLVDGELERADVWVKSIVAGVPTKQMPGDFQFKKKE